jgi:prefoldin subunit 5
MLRVSFGSLLALFLLQTACTKAAKVEENKNAAQTSRSQEAASQAPHLQPTTRGDVERAALEISNAKDALKTNQWQEASAHLQNANKEVKVAIGRGSQFSGDFQELSSAIDRAIATLDRHDKAAESQLNELQTRIMALKVKTTQNS